MSPHASADLFVSLVAEIGVRSALLWANDGSQQSLSQAVLITTPPLPPPPPLPTYANTCALLLTPTYRRSPCHPSHTCPPLPTPANTCQHLPTPPHPCAPCRPHSTCCPRRTTWQAAHPSHPSNTFQHLPTSEYTRPHLPTHADPCTPWPPLPTHATSAYPCHLCQCLPTPADTCGILTRGRTCRHTLHKYKCGHTLLTCHTCLHLPCPPPTLVNTCHTQAGVAHHTLRPPTPPTPSLMMHSCLLIITLTPLTCGNTVILCC
jgi:hypothetical protein